MEILCVDKPLWEALRDIYTIDQNTPDIILISNHNMTGLPFVCIANRHYSYAFQNPISKKSIKKLGIFFELEHAFKFANLIKQEAEA